MALPDSVGAYWLGQQRISAATLALVKRLWLRMGNDFDESWDQIAPTLVGSVEQAQLASANLAVDFVPTVLDEQGLQPDVLADVVPESFVGVTGGGVELGDAMYRSVIESKTAVASGLAPADALSAGAEVLQMLVQTTLSDTGRAAESVGITARPSVGYVRMLNPPSCARCVILAGRFYKWSAGFRRHPRCDCRHVPSTQKIASEISVDPDRYFRSLSKVEQDAAFGPTAAQAIRDGADISQVVNADRGMQRAQVYGRQLAYTTEGTTKRGVAGKLIRARGRTPTTTPRLMPEAIYEVAESREDALRLLKLNGYVLERSGPASGVGSRTGLVPDLDELLNVPLHQLPTVDLDRVIASGRVMSSPPVVRPSPPVQVPVPLAEATPQQVLDTAAGISAHLRLELNRRKDPIDRATPLNPVAYDLPEIADSVLQAGLNVQPLEYIYKPVNDRASTTAVLDSIFGQNRTYMSESPHRGVTRPYSSTSIETGDRADALRVAVALKQLGRDDINFDVRPGRFRVSGTAQAPTLVDEILADGLNVEHLIDPDILPGVDTAIRSRLDELISAAKVKDDAVLAAEKAAESAAAKLKWDENRAKTGAPFKGYLTTYRGTDVESLSQNKLYEVNQSVHSWLSYQAASSYRDAPAGRLTGGARTSDFDMRAVTNEIIETKLNVAGINDPDADFLESEEIGSALWSILQKHRRVESRPLPVDVTGSPKVVKSVKGGEFVDEYSDFAAAMEELDFDIGDSEQLREVFDEVLKSGLNMRLIGDPSAPAPLKMAAQEKFWRMVEGDTDEVDVAPSPAGAARGLTVAREPAGFSANEPVTPEIDGRVGFMERLQFENDFLSVPFAARQILGDTGVRVVASRKVSEGPFAAMFDGITSADGRPIDAISFYQNQIKAVVISTDAPHGSVNVVAHEIGHALDSNTLRDNPIDVRWQEQGNPNLPASIVARAQEPVDYTVGRFVDDPYIQWAHKEFVEANSGVNDYYRSGSEGTSVSGREEWIAEGYAALVMGNPAQLAAISGGSREAMDILAWTFRRMGVLP
ncbi:hypothetical protein [Rhodococcus sp. B10]|uniref:VG15 protein n=1 Tax=Rhodococcus sp. B10 TaxID=2695876 RepID=UPI0014316416|nr:hypothetical protein [Rhodococcus sp. B10]NIL77614.1 hypothetical protein [Rhodococcus sp. B10]